MKSTIEVPALKYIHLSVVLVGLDYHCIGKPARWNTTPMSTEVPLV